MSKVQIHVFSGPSDRVYLRVQTLGDLWHEFAEYSGEQLSERAGRDGELGYNHPDCDIWKHHGYDPHETHVPLKKRYTCKCCTRPDYTEISCAAFFKHGVVYVGPPVLHDFEDVDEEEAERLAVERLIEYYNDRLDYKKAASTPVGITQA